MNKAIMIMILIFHADKWAAPQIEGDCPPALSGLTLTAIGSNRAILFGGYESGRGKSNAVYVAELTKDVVVSYTYFNKHKMFNFHDRPGKDSIHQLMLNGQVVGAIILQYC